jgi:phosphinothricin acetyltransferase
MEAVTIKPLQKEHWEQVKQIYESGIATGIATFETSAPGWEKWNDGHLTFARLVAVENNEVVGWAALSPVSGRCVYGGVAEVSV